MFSYNSEISVETGTNKIITQKDVELVTINSGITVCRAFLHVMLFNPYNNLFLWMSSGEIRELS